jgi:hypothetical protein
MGTGNGTRQPGWFFVGADLGQAQDFTAIAVMERAELKGDWDPVMYAHRKETVYHVRLLERLALGTPYPDVVARVAGITRSAAVAKRCHLAVDATGAGRPVVDMLRRSGLGCNMFPVTITGGDRESREGGHYRVPKRDLITGLQTLLQAGQLRIASGLPYAHALEKEMAEMRVKVTAPGREQFGAWREGTHDDLVLAVALANWASWKVYPRMGSGWWGAVG